MSTDPVAQELRWYLQRDYEGELGVRSSMALQLETIQLGGRRANARKLVDLSDSILHAATKLRLLEQRWRALTDEHRDVLWCVYGRTRRHLPEYGELGTLVLFLAHKKGLFFVEGRPVTAWLSRLKGRESARYLRIRDDAQAALDKAREAWERTWQRRVQ